MYVNDQIVTPIIEYAFLLYAAPYYKCNRHNIVIDLAAGQYSYKEETISSTIDLPCDAGTTVDHASNSLHSNELSVVYNWKPFNSTRELMVHYFGQKTSLVVYLVINTAG